jgi:hypothetical protein
MSNSKPDKKFEIVGSNGRKFPVATEREGRRLMDAAATPDEDGNVIVLRERATLYGAEETRLMPPFTLRVAPWMGQPRPNLPKRSEAAYKTKANLPPELPFDGEET